jgi:methylenetetrahydrofolate dehydrogenase (NADP+)/methenyltetrahydrofolate cyclohydrolase
MAPILLDGKLVAARVEERVKDQVDGLLKDTGASPGLAVVMVGDDPASRVYVNAKNKKATKLGIRSQVVELPSDVAKSVLIEAIQKLNGDPLVDAVLVQLPLPPGFDTWEILDYLVPEKDVDRFHPVSLGMVMLNRTNIFPCTPAGVLEILDYYHIDVTGMNVVVVGRSFIVGKPLAAMLTNRHATVTLCHTRTRNLSEAVKNADMVVAAAGKPGVIKASMVKEGSILIDVGTNYIDQEEDVLQYGNERHQKRYYKKGYAIVGDIDFRAYEKSSYYTPVPGGVGIMTVAMLMENSVKLFRARRD